jgi:hypothetical protein
MAQNGFGRIIVILMVKSVYAAEVLDAGFRADSCTAKENDVFALRDPFLKLLL